jgi:hypothetical protein
MEKVRNIAFAPSQSIIEKAILKCLPDPVIIGFSQPPQPANDKDLTDILLNSISPQPRPRWLQGGESGLRYKLPLMASE